MKLPKLHVKTLTHRTIKVVQDNSPAILAGIGAAGVVGTAVLTAKSTIKAVEIVKEDTLDRAEASEGMFTGYQHSRGEIVRLVWKCYIPPVVAGSLSVAAVIGSHHISTKRLAGMTAAYALSQGTLEDYKQKVEELYGKNKEQKVRDAIAQDKVSEADEDYVIKTGHGDQLFMDAYSGRVFSSSMEEVKGAQNNVNHEVLKHGYASLSDLYDWLGLDHTKLSNDVGWNSDKLMEMTFSTTMTNGGKSCIVVDFVTAPVRNFFRANV